MHSFPLTNVWVQISYQNTLYLQYSFCGCGKQWTYRYTYRFYLTISSTSQHTSFPMLTLAPLNKASLISSKRPFFEDSKSEVSWIEKANFFSLFLTKKTYNFLGTSHTYNVFILTIQTWKCAIILFVTLKMFIFQLLLKHICLHLTVLFDYMYICKWFVCVYVLVNAIITQTMYNHNEHSKQRVS